jgi:hypothetical protein
MLIVPITDWASRGLWIGVRVAAEVPEEGISNHNRNTQTFSWVFFQCATTASYAQTPHLPFAKDVRQTEVVQVPPFPYASVVIGIRIQAPPLLYESVDIGIDFLILIIL